jgi:NADH dehydrogenase FAD-containing subunit
VDAVSVKPISNLWELRRELERRFRERTDRAVHVAIGGGGATGVELAANIASLAELRGGRVEITVYVRGNKPLRPLPDAARHSLLRHLAARGVNIRLNASIERLGEGKLFLADGSEAPYDLFLNATGLYPPEILRSISLPLSENGGLAIDKFLRSTGAPLVFGGGDCVALEGHALPKIGVFAIRQAPVIFHNLLATLSGGALQSFEPQKRFLAIMTLGTGRGLAIRGSLWWQGRAAFWLKDWIDRRFLSKYQNAAGQSKVTD